MGILRDYHCENHGIFEAWEPVCPMKMCKGALSIVHLKPVGTRSARTKVADISLNGLAKDFDMTNIKSTKAGEHQEGYLKRKNKLSQKEFDFATQAMENQAREAKREARPGDAAMWGGAGGISMGSVMGGQFKPVRDEAVSVLPKQTADFAQPKVSSFMADPDNLKVKT